MSALEALAGQLCAGASNFDEGGSIWRSANGSAWTQVSAPGIGASMGITKSAIMDLAVFNDKLFASTGWSGRTSQLWVSPDGKAWSQIPLPAFVGIDELSIPALGVHDGPLYAGICGITSAEIWRSAGSDYLTWIEVVSGGLGDVENGCVSGFATFNGELYAAVENWTTGMRIWRSTNGNAGTWQQVNATGFGAAENTISGGLAVFNGQLYAGTQNNSTGGQIWRTSNGTSWATVVGNGSGDPLNQQIAGFTVSNGELVTVANNFSEGLELWSSSNGTTWQQRGMGGFGDSNNSDINRSNATVFNGSLFIGTWNWSGNGGELWQKVNDLYLPLVR